ncbi:MAG: methyltransferase, partial [Dehalococcoidia bacterium]|nr:methyltransferase [Dehalococcoidia bacterium]
MDGDPYFHKIVPLRHEGGLLRLRVSQALFSSYEVDTGTRFLLRSLAGIEAGSVLDLGCGYGPIGLALKQSAPARTVHMVDRDALAVHYAR